MLEKVKGQVRGSGFWMWNKEISLEQRLSLDRMEQAAELFGSFDENRKLIEQEYGVNLLFRDSELKITGEDPLAVDKAVRAVRSLITLVGSGESLTEQNVRYCMRMVAEDSEERW